LVKDRPLPLIRGDVHKKRVTVNMHNVAGTRCSLRLEPSVESHSSGDLANRAHLVKITGVVVLQKTKSVAKSDPTLSWRECFLPIAWVHTTDAPHLRKQSAQLCNVGRHVHLCSVDDGKKSTEAEFFETGRTLDKTATSKSLGRRHWFGVSKKNMWWKRSQFCPGFSALSLHFNWEIYPE